MPLYIRSEEVDTLAIKLSLLTGSTKTDAVKTALIDAIDRAKTKPAVLDQIAALQAKGKEDGFRAMPDQKAFDDEMSGGI